MDYSKHYRLLIDRAKNRILDGYSERHHIIPRCLGGSNEPDNLVRLTPEEHYVAHQLLVKMHPEKPGLVWAAAQMASRPGNKLYGWVRRRMSEARKGRRQSPEHIAKLAAVRKGRKHTDAQRAKISAANKGKKKSDEVRARMAEAARARGISDETRAKINTTNAGRKRGQYSEEHRARISEALKGRRFPPEFGAKVSASLTGRKLTAEHRQAIGRGLLGKKRGPYKRKGQPDGGVQ